MVVRHWQVDRIEGLSGEAEQARERLMAHLAKSERVARRLADRKQSAAGALASA
jgi:hypothetical protein